MEVIGNGKFENKNISVKILFYKIRSSKLKIFIEKISKLFS